jgi:hypothetical protein
MMLWAANVLVDRSPPEQIQGGTGRIIGGVLVDTRRRAHGACTRAVAYPARMTLLPNMEPYWKAILFPSSKAA